ncbi:putative conserved hypothetical protein [Diplodia seriata]|uniref:Uncharacterized protein n=1 Tax=Diplodia seriata TaxID=420778 RepID=A0A0G2DUB4_9PEZI|nr:putative conserved hypothetical protein [Diplodia seriata]
MAGEPTEQKVKTGVAQTLRAWGDNPLPATLTATLITAQHMRPFQPLPMLFPPVLLLSSYLNLNGYKKDAAGMTAAWSGLSKLERNFLEAFVALWERVIGRK